MIEPSSNVTVDPWSRLRRHTAARIALGRAGASLPTAEVLRFALDHALARDAVHAALDIEQLENDLAAAAWTAAPRVVRVASRVADRAAYLHRPDLGRQLDDASRE